MDLIKWITRYEHILQQRFKLHFPEHFVFNKHSAQEDCCIFLNSLNVSDSQASFIVIFFILTLKCFLSQSKEQG